VQKQKQEAGAGCGELGRRDVLIVLELLSSAWPDLRSRNARGPQGAPNMKGGTYWLFVSPK
jgi:hypothetical protein